MGSLRLVEKAIGIIAAVIFVSLVGFVALDVAVLDNNPADGLFEINSDHLYLDSKDYVEYADVAFLDDVKYPDLLEQGLFWHTFNTFTEEIVEAPADSTLGASFVDPNKPTIIFIHGMEASGYRIRNTYLLPDFLDARNELGISELSSGADVSMLYLWLRKGYNVGFFHWERFSGGLGSSIGETPMNNEERIWATDGQTGTRFVDAEGVGHFDGTEYSIAENFAAEYIRAMRLLPDTMGDKEIRIQSHSMGGEVTAAGVFLLTELADPDVNQLPEKQLPDRYSLMDTYFSMNLTVGDKTIPMTVNDITISWSKKPLPKDGMKDTILDCLKVFANHGIVMDYYTYHGSTLKLGLTPADVQVMLQLMTITDLDIDWASYYPGGGLNSLGWITASGHVAMLYYVSSSISTPDMLTDLTSGEYAPSARMSSSDLKNIIGNYYLISGGTETFDISDDTFTQPGIEALLNDFNPL